MELARRNSGIPAVGDIPWGSHFCQFYRDEADLIETLIADGTECVAVAVDARSAASLTELPTTVKQLKEEGHDVKVMYLTASTHSLVARFSETRRRHPLSRQAGDAHTLSPQDIKFAKSLVLYEDEMVIAINKPHGLAVQGGARVLLVTEMMPGSS